MDQILATGGTVTLVHFTYPVGDGWRIGCMPNMTEFHSTSYHPNYQRSNDTRAVTCKDCKNSANYKVAADALAAGLGKVTRG